MKTDTTPPLENQESTYDQDPKGQDAIQRRLADRMAGIRHKVLVLSGKGGVGKSTISANLALALAQEGRRVGLLDVDIHGPSIPTMLGLTRERAMSHEGALLPVEIGDLRVMSMGLLLGNAEEAVIWRGPLKMAAIRQLLADVEWGDLDYLVVDAPPGTGDEPLSVCQLVGSRAEAVIVTTPQEVALVSVRKSVNFCRQLGVPVLGVVENMSGYVCPECGKRADIFGAGGGEGMAREMGVPFLGRIPLDAAIALSGDAGRPLIAAGGSSAAASALQVVARSVASRDSEAVASPNSTQKESSMRIAIPLADGRLCAHFGHCERFALVDVDPKVRSVVKTSEVVAPPHEPGLLPAWLAERGATVIIAGGMGQRAQSLFSGHGIQVIVGAPAEAPEVLAESFLSGALVSGTNVCDH